MNSLMITGVYHRHRPIAFLILLLLICSSEVWAGYAAYVQSLNPLAYYRLNDSTLNSGVGVALDSSGNGYHGTYRYFTDSALLQGGALAPYDPDPSAAFSNIIDAGFDYHRRVELPPSLPLPVSNQPFTASYWVNPTSYQDYGTALFWGTHPANGFLTGWDTPSNSGVLRVGRIGHDIFYTTTGVPLNAWSHIALSYDGTTVRFYLNGVLDSWVDDTLTVVLPFIGPVGWIGGWGNLPTQTSEQPFQGRIDEVAIFARALSDEEISYLADPATTIIPEPTTAAAVLLGVTWMLNRRRGTQNSEVSKWR